ncbi:MAG: M28 family peptidase [Candidatus Krumholzibacteriia bacterium]
MPRLVLVFAVLMAIATSAHAAPPRAVVQGAEPPAGVTVLDRRGDRWLVTGPADVLAALPGARLLAEPPAVFTVPSAPAGGFVPLPTPLIDDLVAQVDAAELMAQVQWIVSLGVRYSTLPAMGAVADSLEAKLASYGLATEQHMFPMGSQGTLSVPNVVATQTGRVHPDSVYVICAHYDATSENPVAGTPGADDNASGTAAVLTAARLLSGLALDYTVKYVLFAGEEQGLVGSGHWVADMATEGLAIKGALNFDMIAWWEEGAPFDLEIETNNASRPLADAICWAADTYTTMTYELHVDDGAWWGDFYSFWQHGYAAVNHEEAWDWGDPDFNPYYHSSQDTPDKLSPEFFTGGVRIGVASLAALAGVADVSAVPGAPAVGASLTAGPNPFNGRVVLRLAADLPDGPQTVRIYDLRGRRVGEVAVPLRGGEGEAAWDARGAAGRTLPAGVYLARAEGVPGRVVCRVAYVP